MVFSADTLRLDNRLFRVGIHIPPALAFTYLSPLSLLIYRTYFDPDLAMPVTNTRKQVHLGHLHRRRCDSRPGSLILQRSRDIAARIGPPGRGDLLGPESVVDSGLCDRSFRMGIRGREVASESDVMSGVICRLGCICVTLRVRVQANKKKRCIICGGRSARPDQVKTVLQIPK